MTRFSGVVLLLVFAFGSVVPISNAGYKALAVGSKWGQTANVVLQAGNLSASIVSGRGSLTIPANALRPGDTIRIFAYGHCKPVSATIVDFRFKFGAAVVDEHAHAEGIATEMPYQAEALWTVRTVGASGTIVCHSQNRLYNSNTASVSIDDTAGGTFTIDTTVPNLVDLTCVLDNNASDFTISNITVEVLK